LSFIEIKNLQKFFPIRKGVFSKRKGFIKAVDEVSFSIAKGETLGLVGEAFSSFGYWSPQEGIVSSMGDLFIGSISERSTR
jgi:ABC-type microcin C transport system duplicated ATPase subunit YejF